MAARGRRRSSRLRLVAFAAALAVAAAGCSSAGATATTGGDPAAPAGALTGVAAQAEGRVWIDVRTPAEVAAGALDGALHIDLQGPDFRQRIAELPRDDAYFVYCRTGNRSGQAAAIMAELGFTDVVNGGGYDDLVRAGLPAA